LVKVNTGRSKMLSGTVVEDVRRELPWREGGWSSPVTVPYAGEYELQQSVSLTNVRPRSDPSSQPLITPGANPTMDGGWPYTLTISPKP